VFAELIRFLIAAACALFVLSLPLSKTQSGAALRRWAGVCFILAFLPSLVVGLFYARAGADATSASATGAAASPAQDFLSGLGCVAAVVLAVLIAYGVLKLRSRFRAKSKPRDSWETFFNRGGGKRPFHINARPSRGPFSFAGDEVDEDED
jgi:protein-S-isoprenylcysteine O-methyltransferase Ste14